MDKIVKARKEHVCNECNNIIKIGDSYHYGEYREPKYGSFHGYGIADQIGINYIKYRLCLKCV